jgi:hypothetical protein
MKHRLAVGGEVRSQCLVGWKGRVPTSASHRLPVGLSCPAAVLGLSLDRRHFHGSAVLAEVVQFNLSDIGEGIKEVTVKVKTSVEK